MWDGSGERSLLLVIYRDLFELIRLPQQTSAGASVTVSWPEGSNKPLQYRSLIPQSISTSRGREASPRSKKRGGEQPMKDLGGEGRKMKKWRGERERLFTPRLFAGMHAPVTWRLTCDLFKRQQDDCFNHTCKHPAMKCVYGKKKKKSVGHRLFAVRTNINIIVLVYHFCLHKNCETLLSQISKASGDVFKCLVLSDRYSKPQRDSTKQEESRNVCICTSGWKMQMFDF